MPETYSPLQWINDQAPALNASNLNRVEQGVERIDDRVATLELGIVAPVVVPFATSVTLNATQGALFRCVATADLTLDQIIGGTDGQTVVFEVQASGAPRTLSFTGSTGTEDIAAGQWWVGVFRYVVGTGWLRDDVASTGGEPGNDLNILAPQNLSYAATITPNAATGALFRITAPGDFTLANPINGTDGQAVIVEVYALGGQRTVTFQAGYPTVVIPSGARWSTTLRYNAADQTWVPATSGAAGAVSSVNGFVGAVVLDADDLGDGTTKVQMTTAERTKLTGVATGATVNSADAQLRDRATHTGTQAISTVAGLQTALDGKALTGHSHAAGEITSGVIAPARLGSGTRDGTRYLRDDGTWQPVEAGSGGAGPALPTISGLAGWWDAADPDTLWTDTAGTTPATAEGAAVARWDDKSGNGHNATQSTAGSRPLLNLAEQNGQSALYFDGDHLTTTLNPSSVMPEGFTIFSVAKLDDTGSRSWSWIYGETTGGGGASGLFFGKSGNGDLIHFAASTWHDGVDAGAGTIAGTWRVYGHQESDSVRRVLRDGAAVTDTTNSNASLTATSFNIGGRATVEPWKGPIGEVIVYSRVLTLAERQDVEAYLSEKWFAADVGGSGGSGLPAAAQTVLATDPPAGSGLTAITAANVVNDRAALQAQIDYVNATWGEGVIDLPGATIKLDSGLTGLGHVRLVGKGKERTILNFAGAGGSVVGLTSTGNGTFPAQHLKLVGPNTGDKLSYPTNTSTGISMSGITARIESVGITNFFYGVDSTHSNSFFHTLKDVHIGYAGVCWDLHAGADHNGDVQLTEMGERMNLIDSVLYNSQLGLDIILSGVGVFVSNCSLDYLGRVARIADGYLQVANSHIETGYAPTDSANWGCVNRWMIEMINEARLKVTNTRFEVRDSGVYSAITYSQGPSLYNSGFAEFSTCSWFGQMPNLEQRVYKTKDMFLYNAGDAATVVRRSPFATKWNTINTYPVSADGSVVPAGHSFRVAATDVSSVAGDVPDQTVTIARDLAAGATATSTWVVIEY